MSAIRVRIEKSTAEPLLQPASKGKMQTRVIVEAIDDPRKHYRFAAASSKVFQDKDIGSTKENGWQKFLRLIGWRNWVVINVIKEVLKDGKLQKETGFAKVNQESLRLRLGMSEKDFKNHLNQSIDFTDVVSRLVPPTAPALAPAPIISLEKPTLKREDITIARYLNHPERFKELGDPGVLFSKEIKNTPLTQILASITFDNAPDKDLNLLLDQLVQAREVTALTRSNNPDEKPREGVPQNTPLHLLVKMGNGEGVKKILPIYDKESLLKTTPLGNSALHLAVVTLQLQTALDIMKRAEELGVLEELLAIKNVGEFTAEDIYKDFQTIPKAGPAIYKPLLNFANKFFGRGEEINKAKTGEGTLLMHARNRTQLWKQNKPLIELYRGEKTTVNQALNQALVDKIKREHKAKFKETFADRDWMKIHSDHYDWYMFPVGISTHPKVTATSKSYEIGPEELKALQADPEFMKEYREAVTLELLAWGWDVTRNDKVQNPTPDQKWHGYQNHPDRIAKLGDSLWLFGEKDLYESLKKFFQTLPPTSDRAERACLRNWDQR